MTWYVDSTRIFVGFCMPLTLKTLGIKGNKLETLVNPKYVAIWLWTRDMETKRVYIAWKSTIQPQIQVNI